jgi:hypothetical protein
MHDICPNSMSMARTKESLIVDAVDTLRENNSSLLDKNSGTCPVSPQGVPTGLNTSSAAATLRDLMETNQMTTERKEGRFRGEIGSQLFRRMTKARFASLLGIRKPPPRPANPGPVTEGTMPAPAFLPPMTISSVPSSSQLRPRPRSRTISPARCGKYPQDPIPRSRTKSAPEPSDWRSLRSSSPQHAMRRARSYSILTTPGEIDGKQAMNP